LWDMHRIWSVGWGHRPGGKLHVPLGDLVAEEFGDQERGLGDGIAQTSEWSVSR